MEKLYYTNNEEKYDVSFDREEMLKLREEIINKLSNVVHFDYESNKKDKRKHIGVIGITQPTTCRQIFG